MLCSRGHKLVDILSEYPISTVNVLIKAAHYNKISDTLSMANTVAVGAVHAVEAGFSGKQPQALKKYFSNLTRAMKRLTTNGRKDVQADAGALLSGFTGTAQMVKGGNGRHKGQTSGPH